MSRKIIHCDCDCFFAAVEMRDDPSLRGFPLAVGGDPAHRGVVATCNYEARARGVRSAMSSAQARQLCPDLILIPPSMEKYREAAAAIRDIFSDYAELIEPLSLDEAFLDVSEATQCQGSATLIARAIRQRVRDEVGITISAGVAPNKFLAKIASDWNKPDGLFVILPEQVDTFVHDLAVEKLFGVGRQTARRLHAMGIHHCGDLQALDLFSLVQEFGSFGSRLYQLCRGEDSRPVQPLSRRKTLSVERTFSSDLADLAACLDQLPSLLQSLEERLGRVGTHPNIQKLFVKLKFANYQTTTMESSQSVNLSLANFRRLCIAAIPRGEGLAVRLMGLGVRFADEPEASRQLPLFDG